MGPGPDVRRLLAWAAHARSRGRWRRGRKGGGGGAGGRSGDCIGGGLGTPLTAPGAARAGSRRVRRRLRGWWFRVRAALPDSQVGEGRSRSRGQPHGEGAGQGSERGAGGVGSGGGGRGRGRRELKPKFGRSRWSVFFPGVGAEARPVCGALRGSWGYLRGRGGIGVRGRAGWLVRLAGRGPVPAAEQPGKPEPQCRRGCCAGPARPCDPLYSCHNLGTFGAAPNGAPGRPAPREEPPPPAPHPEAPDPRAAVPSGRCRRPWAGSVSGCGSGLGPWGAGRRAPSWSDCAGSRAPRRRGVFFP